MNLVTIIIVNWNSGILLRSCVDSIIASDRNIFKTQIVIVDNNSKDNSIDLLPKDDNIRIIKNRENYGFAAACNIGFRYSDGDYILLLNPDVRLYKDTLSKTFNFFRESNYDVIGIKQKGKGNLTNRGCCRLPTLLSAFNTFTGLCHLSPKIFPSFKMIEWDHESSREVDHVMGSFMFFKRELLNEVGEFDERFFLYYEDLDFSARIRKAFKKIYYWDGALIYHEGGGLSKQIIAKRLFLSLDSRIKYFKKHFPAHQYFLICFTILFIEPLSRIIINLLKRNYKGINETVKAYLMLYKQLLSRILIWSKRA
jgi:hypothetical protein